MSTPPRFTRHRFTVVLGDPDDDATVSEIPVIAIGADVQRVETLFSDRGWGDMAKRPIASASALAYFALHRAGGFDGTFDDFQSAYIEVRPEGSVPVNPTDAAPATD
jgi:hypothetical protein